MSDSGERKQCTRCKESQPLSEFAPDSRYVGGRKNQCRECGRAASRKSAAKRKLRDPYRHRKSMLHCKFGMTEGDYELLLAKQGGGCAICRRAATETRRKGKPAKFLDIDHCHQTGKIRGLLCGRCNVGIGSFEDDVSLLRGAIAYLAGG